ncbi:MAG: hypothetical protein Q8N04_07500 [Nitrospira sp.]|nr:hypothetical protein [Nitrospira sp.]
MATSNSVVVECAQKGANDKMTMGKWLLIAGGVIAISAFIAVFIGQAHESAKADELVGKLVQSVLRPVADTVEFNSLSELPPPVARYFKHVLTEGQKPIRTATIRQSGVLRTSTTTGNWSSFTAHQLVVPSATGFVWNARVEMPLATHVRVLDSYSAGVGSGRVSLLSAFALASESGSPKLNSGALHRYLAEAVWFPTALLPQSGVIWSPINDHSAMATATDKGTTVSLEFRFNEAGEVTSIYSPGRFGRFNGEYKQVPWEGYFRDYQERAGMRVPLYGEVGWYVDGTLQIVWKGDLVDVRYELGP